MPLFQRLFVKYQHVYQALAIGVLFWLVTGFLVDGMGWFVGSFFIVSSVTFLLLSGDHKKITLHLKRFHDDELTQYIFTGSLERASRINLLNGFHERHLHTVLERMHQMGDHLVSMAHINQQRVTNEHQLIDEEPQQLESVASAVQEMSHSIDEIAQNAKASAQASNETEQEAIQGSQELKQASMQISQLSQTMGNTADTVNQLAQDSEEIRQVLAVISGIAAQTNLLALNAAIEISNSTEAVLNLTQALADSANETLSFSDQLNQQANDQNNIIRRFR